MTHLHCPLPSSLSPPPPPPSSAQDYAAARSPLCCRHCSLRNRDEAGRLRRARGLFEPSDLDHWPAAAAREFAGKLLAIAEVRPA